MPTYINEKEDIWTFARVVNPQQIPLTQSDVGSISCSVYDLSSATPWVQAISPSVAVATSVFNSLMTDFGWNQDSVGYNFRHRIANPAAIIGGHTYRIEYKFIATGVQDWTQLFVVKYVTTSPVQSA